MSAPKCRVCQAEHWAEGAACFSAAVSREVKPPLASRVKPVKPPAAEPERSNAAKPLTWRERDPEAYRAYMRGYMARRRAAGTQS
jgi:hypothetical protein